MNSWKVSQTAINSRRNMLVTKHKAHKSNVVAGEINFGTSFLCKLSGS